MTQRPAVVALLMTAVTALAALLLPAGPVAATPAPCPADGVVVLVEYGELAQQPAGDDVRVGCDDSVGGERAVTSIQDAGFALDHATRDPGFLCRVEGVPASDPCVNAAPADAYWSLWWADADAAEWVYSTRGAGTLRSPAGGHLALVWHQGDGEAQPPALAPGEASDSLGRGGDALPAEGASGVTDQAAGSGESGSLPVWVPLGALGALLAAGAFVTLRRRRA